MRVPGSRALVGRFRGSAPAQAGTVIALMLGVVLLFPRPMPFPVYLSGLVFGTWTGLIAVAVVLVFSSNRVIDFSLVQVGATATVLYAEVIAHHAVARLLTGQLTGRHHFPDWALTVEWWGGAALCVLLAASFSAASYLLLVRRLRDAPPLVGTVATLAVSALLAALSTVIIKQVFDDQELVVDAAPPQDVSVTIDGVVFHLPQLVTLGVAVVVLPLLTLFLRRSKVGTGVRASSANAERAATLGVDGVRVTVVVWLLAGALSGLAAVLAIFTNGSSGNRSGASLVTALAAVVIGATVSRTWAFLAGLGTGVLQQGLLWSWGRGELVDVVLLGIVLVVLLVRRRPQGRVDVTDSSWRAAREVRPVPAELRGLRDVRRLRLRGGAVLVVAGLAFPWLVPVGQVQTGTLVLVYAMVGLSLLVLTGWAGLISLGQFAFAAVGGWTAAVLTGSHGVSPLLAIPLAALAGGVAALLLGLPALRIRGLYLAILTLGFAVAVSGVLLSPTYGGKALPEVLERPTLLGLRVEDERAFYYLTLLFAIATAIAVAGLRRSRSARALIASRDNERAAELAGVDLVRARLSAFVLSGVVAALAGALFAFQQQGVDPGNFGPDRSLTVFLLVVLGGLGSLAGPVLGAVVFGVLELLPDSPLTALVLPTAVVIVLVAFPGGLTQAVFAARDAFLRRLALRERVAVPGLLEEAELAAARRARLAPRSGTGYVPRRYELDHQPLEVPRVASTGRGA
jgi:branched-chain amino acid transport system permease protein